MDQVYDLDSIEIAPYVLDRWNTAITANIAQLLKTNPKLSSLEIPDEQFRVVDGMFGEIFVRVGQSELRMRIPRSDWKFAKKE